MVKLKFFGSLLLINLTITLYVSSHDVVQVTSENFDSQVNQSDSVWMLGFFAPWCGFSRGMEPEYKKAATALKGIVKFGTMDCDETYDDVCRNLRIRGFPTIKIYSNKTLTHYYGERTAKAIADAGLAASKKKQLEGGSTPGGSGGSNNISAVPSDQANLLDIF